MRVIPFIISLAITIGLVVLLNTQLPLSSGKTPRLGAFLSPQHGFWQNAEPAELRLKQTVQLPQLTGTTEVYFDERLVPHVYAEQENDAYFVQGYLHAKFRLWQMEFQTHAAGGRLSEILGPKNGTTDFLAIDRFFRRLGMVYAAERSLEKINSDATTREMVTAYTSGVNAYIKTLGPEKYPLEYKLLDYAPEPWTNLKTALFLKYMSYDLAGGDSDFEMTNARNVFSQQEFEALYPVVADSLDPIIPKGTIFSKPGVTTKAVTAGIDSVSGRRTAQHVADLLKPDKDNGSNNWAVNGNKTTSGRPILCNDPHLNLYLPSLWFEMQITTPTSNSYGATFPGSPGIIIGFNDSCSWGVTNAGRDVKDYYEINFTDTTMQQYVFNGKTVNTTFREERIKIKGQPDKIEKIAMTTFGPVMYDKNFENKSKDGKTYAVRWSAHDAGNELLTFYKLNRASNYADYSSAIATFHTPGQNFVFATKTGEVAIRQQGRFPAKWHRQGDFVMPGADTVFTWQGYIPPAEHPSQRNPFRNFVSSANQLPVDTTYPYYIGGSFPLYRGIIINRKLNNMNSISVQDMQLLQTDNYNVFAETARPVLLKYIDQSKLTDEQSNYVEKLRNWNLYNDVQQEGATIFKVWWDSLEAVVFKDEFAKTPLPLRWPEESTLVEGILKDSSFRFVDDINTPNTETIAEAVLKAFKLAFNTLQAAAAENKLAWGKFKDTGVRHLLSIPGLSRLHLNVGGGEHIINATKQYHGPSWRMIVHLTDNIEAYGVYPGGQSGNPGSRYYDNFVDTWEQGKYYPLNFVSKQDAAGGGKMKWSMTFSKG